MSRSRKKSRSRLTTLANTAVSSVIGADNFVSGRALIYNNNNWQYSYPTGFGSYAIDTTTIGVNLAFIWIGTAWVGGAADILITGLVNNSLTLKNFQIVGTNLSLVRGVVVDTNIMTGVTITDTLITVPVSSLLGGTYFVFLLLDGDTRMLPQLFPMQTVTLTSSAASISEGSSATVTLSSVNVPNGTLLPYTITGTADLADTTFVMSTGILLVRNNTATLTVQAVTDALVENTETIIITLDNTGVLVYINIINVP
jgi:hypothetical protein